MLFFDLVVYEIMLLKKQICFPRDKRKFTDNHIIDM